MSQHKLFFTRGVHDETIVVDQAHLIRILRPSLSTPDLEAVLAWAMEAVNGSICTVYDLPPIACRVLSDEEYLQIVGGGQ